MTTPVRFDAKSIRIPTPDGTMFLFVHEDENGKPFAIRMQIGKAGSSLRAWTEAVSLMITLAMKHGASIEEIITELSNTTADRTIYTETQVPVRSGPDGIVVGLFAYNRERYKEAQLPQPRRRGSYFRNPR